MVACTNTSFTSLSGCAAQALSAQALHDRPVWYHCINIGLADVPSVGLSIGTSAFQQPLEISRCTWAQSPSKASRLSLADSMRCVAYVALTPPWLCRYGCLINPLQPSTAWASDSWPPADGYCRRLTTIAATNSRVCCACSPLTSHPRTPGSIPPRPSGSGTCILCRCTNSSWTEAACDNTNSPSTIQDTRISEPLLALHARVESLCGAVRV